MKHSQILKPAAVAFVLMLQACGSQEGTQDASQGLSFVKPEVRWSSLNVPVCWEQSAHKFPTEKQWVRSAVESQYAKTRLRFTGWNLCSRGARGIRIGVSDRPGENNPHTKGLGDQIDGMSNGMVLNFTFNTWSQACKNKRKKCIQSIGVHEFGHAIGLAHEQNRPDTPGTCSRSSQGSNNAVRVGAWDLNSTMNYCNPVYNNNGAFSRGDLAGIAYLYGSSEPVECRPGYKAVKGNICQNKSNPNKHEVYFELAWWSVNGPASGRMLNLSGRQVREAVPTTYLTATVDAGGRSTRHSSSEGQSHPGNAAPPSGRQRCKAGFQAHAQRYCRQAIDRSQYEVHYKNVWWRFDEYADSTKAHINISHPDTGISLKHIAVKDLTLVF